MTTLKLSVGGMECASCATSVEKALKNVPGVESASVSISANEATVSYDSARTDAAALGKAVIQAGYSIDPKTNATSHERSGGHCGSAAGGKSKGGCCCG
jgi:copper chaperone CopZ